MYIAIHSYIFDFSIALYIFIATLSAIFAMPLRESWQSIAIILKLFPSINLICMYFSSSGVKIAERQTASNSSRSTVRSQSLTTFRYSRMIITFFLCSRHLCRDDTFKMTYKNKGICEIPLLDNDICERHFCRSQNRKARFYR